jgi:hypothetical protein
LATTVSTIATLFLSGCGSTPVLPVDHVPASSTAARCDKKACIQPGVYLLLGLEPTAASATICVDSDCKTIPVDRHDGLDGPDQQYALRARDALSWVPGRVVNISMNVLDAAGTSLVNTTQTLTMAPPPVDACHPCPSFTFRLRDGQLEPASF